MFTLHEALPYSVTVGGRDFALATDFRDWLRFDAMLQDKEITETEMLYTMLAFFEPDENGAVVYPQPVKDAIEALTWFYRGGEAPDTTQAGMSQNSQPAYDFAQDAKYIYAAFMQAYGINLSRANLHWWEFCALVGGLTDDTLFGRIVGIRTRDTSEMSQRERQQHQKLLRVVALGNKQQKPLTLQQRDKQMIEQMQRRTRKGK